MSKEPKTKFKMVRNLLGKWVVSDESLEDLSRKGEQGMLFETELSPEERRARKLAEDHKAEGGQELFESQD